MSVMKCRKVEMCVTLCVTGSAQRGLSEPASVFQLTCVACLVPAWELHAVWKMNIPSPFSSIDCTAALTSCAASSVTVHVLEVTSGLTLPAACCIPAPQLAILPLDGAECGR